MVIEFGVFPFSFTRFIIVGEMLGFIQSWNTLNKAPPKKRNANVIVDRSKFNPISKAATQRLEEIKKMITDNDWKDNSVVVVPPSFHMVDAAYRVIRGLVVEKKLFMARQKLTEEEHMHLVPKATNKCGVYFMVIGTSKALANHVLNMERAKLVAPATIITPTTTSSTEEQPLIPPVNDTLSSVDSGTVGHGETYVDAVTTNTVVEDASSTTGKKNSTEDAVAALVTLSDNIAPAQGTKDKSSTEEPVSTTIAPTSTASQNVIPAAIPVVENHTDVLTEIAIAHSLPTNPVVSAPGPNPNVAPMHDLVPMEVVVDEGANNVLGILSELLPPAQNSVVTPVPEAPLHVDPTIPVPLSLDGEGAYSRFPNVSIRF